MKKSIFTLLLAIGFCLFANAQLVINEIMYNSPDGGADSIEFIELYNNADVMINLQGYSFTQGINYTFPNINLPSGAYLVLTSDSLAMLANFGVTAYQWSSGGLSNSGEDIEIIDPLDVVIDFVDYTDGLPWPIAADGDGSSLELCSANKENAGATFWSASTNASGVILGGIEVLASPGAANSQICPDPDVTVTAASFNFTPADITIFVGQTVEWINNAGNHNVNGSIATFPNNPEGFSSGAVAPAPWSYSHTFNTIGNYDYQCDPHVGLGMVGTVTVLPAPPSDIVITEILYNIPGVDNNFDFIEIHNRSTNPVNLDGYSFVEGVDFTFPAMMLAAGGYLVITEDASAFNSVFGGNALSWTTGGLNDNGEPISLLDAGGDLVDNVIYNDNDPWPEISDGEGTSLIVCDPSVDNSDASNWGFSVNNTGIVSGGSGNLIYASPGMANGACPTAPHIFFNNAFDNVDEGGLSIDIDLLLANTGMNDTADVELMIMSSSTATNGFDFTLSSTIVSFSPNGVGGVSKGTFTIFVLDDTDIEGSETIVLTLKNPTNGAVIASTGEMIITIVDNDGQNPDEYPLYAIQDVTTQDANVEPDSNTVQCELRGIVYGVNLRPGGLEFFIVDKNDNDDGIGVFSSSNNFDYTVQEGDEVSVLGTIDIFNGWTQIAADTVILLSSNNPLFDPEFVTTLDESTESKLVRINNLTVVSETQTGTSGTNVVVTDGTNEYTLRIDADTELFGMTLPPNFDAIGMGSQFDDSDAPIDEDYQFIPRYLDDILELVSTNDPDLAKEIRYYPNPATDQLTLSLDIPVETVVISNVLGQQLKSWKELNGTNILDISDLSSGTYVLTFNTSSAFWSSTFVVR